MFFWLLGPCMQPFLPGNVLVLQRPAQVLLPPTNFPLTKVVTPRACAFIKKKNLPRTLSLSIRGHTSSLHGALTIPPHSPLPEHLLKSSELTFLKQENNRNHLMRPRKLQLIRDSTSLVAQWWKKKKKSACKCKEMQETWVLIPALGKAPGEGNGNPLQYSCLENPMDRGAWRTTVHTVTQSQPQLS